STATGSLMSITLTVASDTGRSEPGGMVTAPGCGELGRAWVHAERVVADPPAAAESFRRLVEDASPADLARPSDGTKWTNRQLLFQMWLGSLLMRRLIRLAGVFPRLPGGASRVFARLLNAVTGPFHWINYLGSCAGAKVFPVRRLAGKMDQLTLALEQQL